MLNNILILYTNKSNLNTQMYRNVINNRKLLFVAIFLVFLNVFNYIVVIEIKFNFIKVPE